MKTGKAKIFTVIYHEVGEFLEFLLPFLLKNIIQKTQHMKTVHVKGRSRDSCLMTVGLAQTLTAKVSQMKNNVNDCKLLGKTHTGERLLLLWASSLYHQLYHP